MPRPRKAANSGRSSKPSATLSRDERYVREDSVPLINAAEEDCARLIHSSWLRRLCGITQVVAASLAHPYHNRLTHVIEVAEIGWQLARHLIASRDGKELIPYVLPEVVYAACIAHDLGHPCFGHIAEHELDELALNHGLDDGFEGNAQSFRIVTRLAIYPGGGFGLNLSAATLNALLKYPWLRSTTKTSKKYKKWNAYKTEAAIFRWARGCLGFSGDERSLEAELMDWADDIAYSVHDLEDFYRTGEIPLDRLGKDEELRAQFTEKAKSRAQERKRDFDQHGFREALEFLAVEFSDLSRFDGSADHRLRIRNLTSYLVRRYVRAIKATSESGAPRLHIDANYRHEIEVLKELTWQYIIDGPPLASQQHGQREVVKTLFNVYHAAVQKDRFEILPVRARGWIEELRRQETDWNQERTRVVVDLIAGMTESQAISLYQQFIGIRPAWSLKTVDGW